jgi:hypothetical protein
MPPFKVLHLNRRQGWPKMYTGVGRLGGKEEGNCFFFLNEGTRTRGRLLKYIYM